MRFDTKLIHAANPPDAGSGDTTTPIHQTAAYAYDSAAELESVFAGKAPGYVYSRLGNPTLTRLEQRLAAIEGGRAALVSASGMAALTGTIMTLAQAGDEIVAATSIFGGTYSLLNRTLRRCGITPVFVDPLDPTAIDDAVSEKTRLVIVETIGNPKLDVPDIAEIAAVTRRHQVALLVDSTATTPCLVQPISLGADIVLHSTSKYLSGNGSCIGGAIIDSGNFSWPAERYGELRKEFGKFGQFAFTAALRGWIHRDLGGCLSPFNAFLISLGLDTLGVRMRQQCETAAKLAAELARDERLEEVNYPGLPAHPGHQTARCQFNQQFGALLTLRLGSKERAFKFLDGLQSILQLTNLGDVKTLAIHPASTFARDADPDERRQMGITEDLVRLSIGLEDAEDLLADIGQSLEGLSYQGRCSRSSKSL